MGIVKGCDLSAIQGAGGLPDPVWQAMAEEGLKFAVLRLLVGNETWTDVATVRANAERARAHGIAVAPYFFPYPLPHLDPVEQVERFVKLCEGLGTLVGDLPPMWDGEWPPREEYKVIDGVKTLTFPWKKWGCSATQIKDWTLRGLERAFELTGLRWLFYSFRYWLMCVEVEKSPEFAQYGLSLADYGYSGRWPSDAQVAALKVPAPWAELAMLQHDGDGGLRLPSGGDADFDLVPSDEKFRQLLLVTGNSRHDALDPGLLDVAVDGGAKIMLDESIAAYRASRIDVADLPA